VQMEITSRLERLAPAQQLVLKAASVLGMTFRLGDLAEIYPIRAETKSLPEQLDSIVQLGLLVRSEEGDNTSYGFKYGLIQEVAHSLLLFSQRRQLEERLRNSR
jgi:predicted ATPase